jgi:hypothetical protein
MHDDHVMQMFTKNKVHLKEEAQAKVQQKAEANRRWFGLFSGPAVPAPADAEAA